MKQQLTWGDYIGITGILSLLGSGIVWCLTHGPPEPEPIDGCQDDSAEPDDEDEEYDLGEVD